MDSAQVSTTENSVLGILWTRLRETNSDIDGIQNRVMELQRLEYQMCCLEVPCEPLQALLNTCEEQLIKLREHKTTLEERRNTTRLAINEQLRPTLRPLKVLDLPNELLRHIFDYVRGETTMYKLAFYDFSQGDVAQVKNLRLTCRRFCDNSSHLLMVYVKVAMTPQSLAHLEEVSQHPTISKGIRAIKISLGRHFDAGIAHDIRAFAHYQASRLRGNIETWERNVEHPMLLSFNNTPIEVYERAIDRAIVIARSWEDAAQSGLNENCPEHVLLNKAQEQYQRYYESQVHLQLGAFAQAVVNAMTRMPTATWLSIVDKDIHGWMGPEQKLETFFPEDLEDLGSLQLKLQAPVFSWSTARYQGLMSPPIDIIPSILLSIGNAGICLKGIDIRIPPPKDLSSFSTTEIEHPKLRATSQQLQAFTFNPRFTEALSMDTSNLLSGFLSTILDTSALQKIHLGFDFQYGDSGDLQPTFSMAPILLSRTWPNLKELSFNGPFYFEELQKVVNRIGKDVELEWSGYLMDASWAEVLDFLQGRVSYNARLGDVNGSIAGAECEDMTREEINFIFQEDIKVWSGSRATKFIRGWTKTNPVRDWENGELAMPGIITEDRDDEDDEHIANN